jgi:ethanolamine utilization protein EutN
MDLVRVIGTVVARRKDKALEGVQLCLVRRLDENLDPAGEALIAAESARPRATGDLVYIVEGGDAVFSNPDGREMPVDAAVVGLVDEVEGGPHPPNDKIQSE